MKLKLRIHNIKSRLHSFISFFSVNPSITLHFHPSMLSIPQDAIEQCKEAFGFAPKDLQLQVVEHIGRGEDCILIARCGWGKSLVFFLPLVYWSDCIIAVISPLKVLMHEQQKKLEGMGISSISLDGDMELQFDILNQLDSGRYRAVFMTPEFIFSNNSQIMTLWTMNGWKSRLQAVVVDEAHCASTWGNTFRTSYLRLGDLRAKVRPGVAFIAISATLPEETLEDVKKILHLRTAHVINTGNDRSNIRLEVRHLPRSRFAGFNFLTDFEKTIVYVESRLKTMEICDYLRTLVPSADWSKISPYHALIDEETKGAIMDEFKQGRIRILVATEAAGLGCDIPDISRVVQFKCPMDLMTLVQRLGRAARNPELQGLGILLVPHSFQAAKCPNPDLVRYITSEGCRRKVLNEAFGNEDILVENCCDVCHPAQEIPQDNVFKDHVERAPRAPARSPEQKDKAKTKIREWRSMVFHREYEPRCDYFTEGLVLSDDAVEKLGEAFSKVSAAESIQTITSWTLLTRELEDELASILKQYNEEIESQLALDKPKKNRKRARTQEVSKPQFGFRNSTAKDFVGSTGKRGRR